MLIYAHEERRRVAASPERVFEVLADVAHHDRLAGSGEVKSVQVETEGPLRVGSEWTAHEEIAMGRSVQRFVARSTLRELDPPRLMSWTSMPPTKPTPRRIQWWYELEPDGAGGTEVCERVEVDMGPVMNVVMKLPYTLARAPAVAAGMRRTLENLAQASGEGATS